MNQAENKVAIVTGGSSGIGAAVVERLRRAGVTVYEFSRRPLDDPQHLSVDVTDLGAVDAAVKQVLAREGRIDILVCNAGLGISGAVEFTDPAEAHRLMEVNLFGMTNVIQAALTPMREAGKGRIVCVSSLAGLFPIPYQTWYSLSKAAVMALSLSLGNEVRPFGIQVCDVMPGDIHTGFTAARAKSVRGDEAYGGRISRSVSRMEKDELNGMTPDAAAKVIARVALKPGTVKPHYAIGAQYKLFAFLNRVLPARAVRWILYKMYAS